MDDTRIVNLIVSDITTQWYSLDLNEGLFYEGFGPQEGRTVCGFSINSQ